jgi:hypothetical protein
MASKWFIDIHGSILSIGRMAIRSLQLEFQISNQKFISNFAPTFI